MLKDRDLGLTGRPAESQALWLGVLGVYFFPDALKWMGGVTSCDQTDGGWSWARATKRMADGPGNWMAGVLVVPLPAHPFNARIATPTRQGFRTNRAVSGAKAAMRITHIDFILYVF